MGTFLQLHPHEATPGLHTPASCLHHVSIRFNLSGITQVKTRAEFMCVMYVRKKIVCLEIYSTDFLTAGLGDVRNSGVKVLGKCTLGCIPEERQDTTGWPTINDSISPFVARQSGTTGYTGAHSISAWNNCCHRTSQNVRLNCFRALLDGFLLGDYEWSQGQNSQTL